MAEARSTDPSVSLAWDAIKMQVWDEKPTNLRSELVRNQDFFNGAQVRAMPLEQVVFHVIALRRLKFLSGEPAEFIKDYQPEPFQEDLSYQAYVILKESERKSSTSRRRESTSSIRRDLETAEEEDDHVYDNILVGLD